MVIIVVSSPNNFKSRFNFRERIADFNRKYHTNTPVLQPLFLIGNKGGGLPEVKTQLLEEMIEHKDILQTTLEENYQRNAYKIFSGYIWIQCFCSSTTFVLKADDNT